MLTLLWLMSSLALAATFHGTVEFEADYNEADGQVPVGNSPLPYLYIEVYQQVGLNDFVSPPLLATQDVLVDAVRADVNGEFTLDVPNGKVYLLTWLCDDDDAGVTSDADVCVRRNDPEVSASDPQNRKYIWSKTYFVAGTVHKTWNLSCPDDADGVCASTEPASADCSAGDTNSIVGCNKEAVHTYRAAIEPYKTWGSNKPTSANTYEQLCDSTSTRCYDEINLFVAQMQLSAQEGWSTSGDRCDQATSNISGGYDRVCVFSPFSPFRIVHEIGHNIHRRWINDPDSVTDGGLGADPPGEPGQCGTERDVTAEGWADYVSVSAWFNGSDASPTYHKTDGVHPVHDMEDPDLTGYISCPSDQFLQVQIGRFFRDLTDTPEHADEVDVLDSTFKKARNIWSAFPTGSGNRDRDEWGEESRNLNDYFFHLKCKFPATEIGALTLFLVNDLGAMSDNPLPSEVCP